MAWIFSNLTFFAYVSWWTFTSIGVFWDRNAFPVVQTWWLLARVIGYYSAWVLLAKLAFKSVLAVAFAVFAGAIWATKVVTVSFTVFTACKRIRTATVVVMDQINTSVASPTRVVSTVVDVYLAVGSVETRLAVALIVSFRYGSTFCSILTGILGTRRDALVRAKIFVTFLIETKF